MLLINALKNAASIFLVPIWIVGCAIEGIINIPSNIIYYKQKNDFIVNSPLYMDPAIYNANYDINFFEHEKYKKFIYINSSKNQNLEKAYLMINKNTKKMAYVIDNVPIESDIDIYKYSNY